MAAVQHQAALEQARSLVALAGALTKHGDCLNVQVVASRLGLSIAQTQTLLKLLMLAGGENSQTILPLLSTKTGEIELFSPLSGAVHGRPLRLTHQEAQALDAAFELIGLSGQDFIRKEITKAYYPKGSAQTSSAPTTVPLKEDFSERLDAISEAIVAQVALEFDYQAISGSAATHSTRHVGPLALRYKQQRWYLDAFDLDKAAERSFRVDRMSMPVTTEGSWDKNIIPKTAPQQVELVFNDQNCLDLFSWPGLKIKSRRGSRIRASIPWYKNSNWLPRRLLACKNQVKTDNAQLSAAMRRCAKELLSQAKSQ
ncbi:YafY family protein [uncultured Olegusella sp.]|uniref:helix-turn-helix transcriptional regulator n=1 Tax=uncultured Olegusella sp. TaxID=1979846 RepID=UPI002615D6CA|nr:WYL domain-containing protein [uncultured Olegusella sp.]